MKIEDLFKWIFSKVKNPLIEDNLSNRYNEWLCGKKFQNCYHIGPYYGMPQASCRRCGHKNYGIAADFISEWSLPWRLHKKI